MVLDFIFGVLLAILSALVAIFPSFTAPFELFADGACTSEGQWFCQLGSYIQKVDRWVDVGLFVTLVGVLVAALAVFAAVWLGIWVYNHIPGKAA